MNFVLPAPLEDETPEQYLERLANLPEFEGKFTTHPLLVAAANTVYGDRQAEYGDKFDNFQDIAEFWTTYLRLKLKAGASITRLDVALMQDLSKTARMMKTPAHPDSRKDKVGYTICFDDILKRLLAEGMEP